jgi:hypothetical protein
MLVSPYIDGAVDFDVPQEYDDLIHFQRTLHPDSIFLGCFSLAWSRLQERYLKLNQYHRNKGQARNGIKTITTYLLDFVHSVWLL